MLHLMMLNLLDRLVSWFSISRQIIASLVARLVALFLLPSSPSLLAPGESAYASLALWVADSKDVDDFPGFGSGLYSTSKTLILPAAVLINFGLSGLTAVQIVSIAIGSLSNFFFAKIILFVLGLKQL